MVSVACLEEHPEEEEVPTVKGEDEQIEAFIQGNPDLFESQVYLGGPLKMGSFNCEEHRAFARSRPQNTIESFLKKRQWKSGLKPRWGALAYDGIKPLKQLSRDD